MIIRLDQRRSVLGALSAVVLLAAGLSIALNESPAARVLGITVLVLVGVGLLVNAAQIVRPMVIVRFGPSGVWVRGVGSVARQMIPWDAIASVRIARQPFSRRLRILGFVPADGVAPLWAARRFARWSTRLAGFPVTVSEQLIPMKLEELVEQMRRFHPGLVLDD